MKCEKCGGTKFRIFNTSDFGDRIARQRVCQTCGEVYYSVEEFIDEEAGHEMISEKRRRWKAEHEKRGEKKWSGR